MHSAAAYTPSFSQQFSIKPEQIFLVRARDNTNKPAWYYVAVDADKLEVFPYFHKAQRLNLLDFGRIMHSGYGNEPPLAIKDMMRRKYGFSE